MEAKRSTTVLSANGINCEVTDRPGLYFLLLLSRLRELSVPCDIFAESSDQNQD